MFDKFKEEIASTTSIIRIVTWLMSVIGHFLLFSPILAVLKWIPLVGGLLAAIAGFAAFVFSLVWATFLHFLVMGAAWIFYRPVLGFCMLCMAAICFYMMTLTPGGETGEPVVVDPT
jgi:small-conductance mechanosensitive channel